MTALTRELERTRNGAKVMERTLEAAAAEIARLREGYADSQDRIKALEDALRECTRWSATDSNAKRIAAAALLEKK